MICIYNSSIICKVNIICYDTIIYPLQIVLQSVVLINHLFS